MTAHLLIHEKQPIAPGVFKEIKIWQLPVPLMGCAHRYKYSLAFIAHDRCVLRYDNERGKGDHKHIDRVEFPVTFVDLAALLADFHHDIQRWRQTHDHLDDSC